MGRTFRSRKRRRKQPNIKYSVEDDDDVVLMNRYIHKNCMRKAKKLVLFNFPDTGRGVMTCEKVEAGDLLLEVPFNLILSICTLDLDSSFSKLFFPRTRTVINNCSFTCQQLLSFYICYIKLSFCDSFWKAYIKTIPTSFCVPYFLQYNCFTSDVTQIVNKQRKDIEEGFSILAEILNNSECSTFDVQSFTLDLYAWAYFGVNSRCVYLNPDVVSSVTKLKSSSSQNNNSFLSLIIDDPNLGLIPFLDMFNHSPQAKTSANLEIKNPLHDPVFRLLSLTKYEKYDQVFIFYGDHSNLKLFTEYGFCIYSNPHSSISFSMKDIISELNLNVSKDKYDYIMKHQLFENIFVDDNGLSYNFLRFIFILTNSSKSSWDSKIYSSEFSNEEITFICKFIEPLFSKISHSYNDIILSLVDSNEETNSYTMLLDEYIKFLKCVNLYK